MVNGNNSNGLEQKLHKNGNNKYGKNGNGKRQSPQEYVALLASCQDIELREKCGLY